MKKALKAIGVLILFYAIIALLLSCTPEDECNCIEEHYELEQYTVIENGLPRTELREVFIGSLVVECQDEGRTVTHDNIVKRVICD